MKFPFNCNFVQSMNDLSQELRRVYLLHKHAVHLLLTYIHRLTDKKDFFFSDKNGGFHVFKVGIGDC